MNNLEKTIDKLKSDMTLDMSREEFLAVCVKSRLEEQTKRYSELFDKFLHNLEVSQCSHKDLDSLIHSLSIFSSTASTAYEYLLEEIKKLEGLLT